MRGLGERLLLGKFSFIKGRDQKYKDAVRAVHAYIDGHVERVLAEKINQKTEKSTTDSKEERYILLNEMAKETQDPVELRYSLLNVFFPAHDAVAVTVNNILFHLAREPEIQARLRADVLAATESQPLSFELLKSIKYLRYIFNESTFQTRPLLKISPLTKQISAFIPIKAASFESATRTPSSPSAAARTENRQY